MSAATAMIRSEGRLLMRNPGVVLWSVVLPVAAAVVVGAIPATRESLAYLNGTSFFAVYQPVIVLFAIAMLAIQALPDVLTRYREMGVLKRLRTTPASPALLLMAQFVLILGVCVTATVIIVVLPAFFGAPLPGNPLGFVMSYLLAAWAFLGLGMVLASLFRNAKVAAGFGTVLFFVLQFFAGLWVQRPAMPPLLRHISDLTASGAASQALADSAAGHWPQLLHLLVLLVWGVATTAIAIRLFKWE